MINEQRTMNMMMINDHDDEHHDEHDDEHMMM
nr:MAG TPA: hypothetical protein [Caudoviricetes sp.]